MAGVLSGNWGKYVFSFDSLFSFGALLETIKAEVVKQWCVVRN